MRHWVILLAVYSFSLFSYENQIKTKEDKEKHTFFLSHCNKEQKVLLKEERIPRIIHFIWLGPKKISSSMKSNISSWIKLHPSYCIKLWTDYPRENVHKSLLVEQVDENALFLRNLYKDTLNYVEKEDLLRLEILKKEGGICVDPNIACLQSMEALIEKSSFLAAMAPVHDSIGGSSVMLSNALIAAKQSHPIIMKTIDNVSSRWKKTAMHFPLDDHESMLYRAYYRLYDPLEAAVMDKISANDHLLAESFFYANLLGKYTHLSHWMKFKPSEKDKLDKNIYQLKQNVSKQMVITGLLFLFSLLVALQVLLKIRRT